MHKLLPACSGTHAMLLVSLKTTLAVEEDGEDGVEGERRWRL